MSKAAAKTKKPAKNRGEISEGRKRSNKNLKPFKPGQSGNPAGRPKGILDFSTRVNYAIERLSSEYVKQQNALKKNKNRQITEDDVDILGDVFAVLLSDARRGDRHARELLFTYIYKKPSQQHEFGGIDGNRLTEAEIAAAEAEIDAWERQWQGLGNKKDYGNKNTRQTAKAGSKK